MLFPVSGAQVKFFRAKTRPENAVGCLALKLVHYSGENRFWINIF